MLPVDNGPLGDPADGRLLAPDHYGSEEVTPVFTRKAAISDPLDVLPKWLPLQLLGPHVGTLVRRHDKTVLAAKELLYRPNERFHDATLSRGAHAGIRREFDGWGAEIPNRLLLGGLLFRFRSSVTSDAEEKVPTGGELTLFEAVGRWA